MHVTVECNNMDEDSTICFLCSLVFILFGILPISIEWASIKGSFLIDTSKLATTQGVIISAPVAGNSRSMFRYQYAVNGITYQSELLRFRGRGDAKDPFQVTLARYPVGKVVTVYYDPGNPSFAVLEPHDKMSLGWLKFLIMLPVFFGILFILALLRAYRRRQRSPDQMPST